MTQACVGSAVTVKGFFLWAEEGEGGAHSKGPVGPDGVLLAPLSWASLNFQPQAQVQVQHHRGMYTAPLAVLGR